ncbi:uncharacterized protein LOC136061741 [Quercus suber]|uniref:uncharacterized protein LOC136061741 n=1 Tax=Quercus suber TaxID=58331 RepID=UPI0032DE5BE2
MSRKKGNVGYMANKIDLEKTYDRLEWSFVRDTLKLFNIPDYLVNVIMSCISSSSVAVLFNEGVLEESHPMRGIRQGDPLSPYLFIMCMEVHRLMIKDKCDSKLWDLVKASRGGLAFSHLLFADDLILFGKADKKNYTSIKEALDRFCELSRQKVNNGKSRVYFSPNISEKRREELCSCLDLHSTPNLGKYLGFSLKLPAIPVYVMQGTMLPTKILEAIDRLNEGSLRSLIVRPLNSGEDQLEMGEVTQKGGWNFSYCSFVFPCGLLQRIKAILIPYLDASLDNISWDYSNYGEFDGRSAYKLAKGESNVTDEFARSWIWKVDTLPKIQCFIWKSYLFSLPAKDLPVTRGIAEDSKCEGCGREAETIIHVLRDCDIAKKFWLDTGNGRCDNNFFTSDLCSWLKENLRSSTDLVEANVP